MTQTRDRVEQKYAEIVAEKEGISTQDVQVVASLDTNETWQLDVTMTTEHGRFRGIWSDGESYSDFLLKLEEA